MATRGSTPVRGRVYRLVPAKLRGSYAAKYAVGFIVVLLLIGAIGGVTYQRTDEALRGSTEDRLAADSAHQAEILDEWLGRLESEARILAGSDALTSESDTRIEGYLQSKARSSTLPAAVSAIHYVPASSEDALTFTPGAEPRETDGDGLPWQVPSAGPVTVVTRPYESPVTGAPAIAVVSPVDGALRGAVVLVVDLESRASRLPKSSDDVYTVVVNDRGTVVMSHHVEDILRQNAGSVDVETVESMAVKRGLEGESGYVEMDRDGERMSMGYAPVGAENWVVMAHEPTASAFALKQDVLQGLLLLLAAAIVGLGVVGLTLGKDTVATLGVLTERARDLEAGDLDVDLETSREDEIGDLFRAFDSMRASLQETIEAAESARDRAERERARSEALVKHLEEKAASYRETMEATAAGDLTRRMDQESQSDAMSEIGEAFNEMAADLEATVGSAKAFADTVTEATATATASTEEVRTAGEDVSRSIQEISDGADDQARSLLEVSAELDDLSATIEEIASSSDEVATTSRRAAELGESGRTAAEEAIEGMNRIENRAQETATAVERMNEEMAAVGDVVELIDGIAGQTTTLALNASIEAARAGEAGQGFAVVAEEVKKLAEDTREATRQIEERIDGLSQGAERSAADVRRMREGIGSGTDAVEEAASALEAIVEAIQTADMGIQEIDDATDEQATSTQEVVARVQAITATGEQVNWESETVAAAAEEQAAALSDVTRHTNRLADRAAELDGVLSAFTIRDAADDFGDEPDAGDALGEEPSPADD